MLSIQERRRATSTTMTVVGCEGCVQTSKMQNFKQEEDRQLEEKAQGHKRQVILGPGTSATEKIACMLAMSEQTKDEGAFAKKALNNLGQDEKGEPRRSRTVMSGSTQGLTRQENPGPRTSDTGEIADMLAVSEQMKE